VSVETEADVLIVGGAVVGSAIAFYLTRLGFTGRIVVVEQDPSYRDCATARSAGGLRQQFSTPENIRLSQATLTLLRNLQAVFGTDADVGFKEQGYLILASPEGDGILADNVRLQQAHGANIERLEADRLATQFPWLTVDGVTAGAFGMKGEGWLDPVILTTLFRKAAEIAGVRYVSDRVTGIDVRGGRVTAAALASGGRIRCGRIVNAAGPWAGALAALAGIPLPVEPRKRYVYVLDCRAATEALRKAPLTVDPSGVWFRPEGQTFICGKSPDEDAEPPAKDLDDIDHDFFTTEVWPMLAQRVPAFEAVKVISAWAGYYDYNTLDQNGIIGAHPEITNFYFANGFSGHGLQQSAGTGRAIAELIVHGAFRTIDLTRFGYERIRRGEPLAELNVI
jgi:FAD-dependent oxidoreductase domain-containing protein 1